MLFDIIITEFMDEHAVRDLEADFEVLYDPNLVERTDEMFRLIGGCRALIVRNRTQVTRELLDHANSLQVVGRLGVGLDNIDVEACEARDIPVVRATMAVESAVAEYVVAAILIMLRRDTFSCSNSVLQGKWPRRETIAIEMKSRRLGLLAFGAIGREVANRALAFGMEVGAYDPHLAADDPVWRRSGVSQFEFDDLLSWCDVLSVHTPLTPGTRGLIDEVAFSKLRPGTFLVNTSRGGVVDEDAMVAVLKSGHLAGAVVDVFNQEPLTADNPFVGVPNLIVTPHVAGHTEEASVRVGKRIVAGVRQVLAGSDPGYASADQALSADGTNCEGIKGNV